jgi:hypothetical protein
MDPCNTPNFGAEQPRVWGCAEFTRKLNPIGLEGEARTGKKEFESIDLPANREVMSTAHVPFRCPDNEKELGSNIRPSPTPSPTATLNTISRGR